ncbi:stalk domain-containing protein [Lysinibacillus sp. LZ02]|uniref:stalk domain-containing protein n=1 Tax=Lysinibacillus sp. LZ02 TaxID=3420668 RepID=UPI003D36E1B6
MKRSVPFALSAVLVGGAFAPAGFANDVEVVPVNASENEGKEEQVQESFIKLTGTFPAFEKRDNGTYYALIEQQDDMFSIVVGEDTVVVDNTGKTVELQEGMEFTAYVNGNKPMILIYPPQYSPDLIVVQTEEMSFAKVAQFDENFANEELKLNISEDTVIENLSGTALQAEDIVGKDVAVFYTFTTFSIPAQTTPSKIIVLSYDEEEEVSEEMSAIQQIIDNDSYVVNGVKMVPLRLIAEKLGWTVKSTGKGAILSKQNASFTITRGEKAYGHNRALHYFEEAPALLEPTKTYVPVDFVELLLP